METPSQRTKSRVAGPWHGEYAHACVVFADDASLIDGLAEYVGGALWAGDGAVVIATLSHLDALESRLRQSGLDVGHFRATQRYATRSAEAMLTEFMVDGWPDADRFGRAAGEVIDRARVRGPEVRIFGEIVDVLWRERRYGAALQLELLWSRLLEAERVPLLCAFGREGFAHAGRDKIDALEKAHSRFLRE